MKKQERVIYYRDEKNDDFSQFDAIKEAKIDSNYIYFPKNAFSKCFSFILYYVFAKPILGLFSYLQGVRVKGRKKLKAIKKQGYILYGNHVKYCDAYVMQVRISFPKRTYMVTGRAAFTIPIVDKIIKLLGAIPIPDGARALINMNRAMDTIIKKNQALVIFPEAHTWKYYTGLREFPVTSFKIAARNNCPVVPVASTFKKRKFFGRELPPKMIYNVLDPIFPNTDLSVKENAQMLRDATYNAILKVVSSEDNYAYYQYIKADDESKIV